MNESNQPPNEPPDRDDLRQIRGIGPFVEQALNELGIYRFADLATHTPEKLAELLKSTRSTISPQRIERDDWIGQARLLAQAAAQSRLAEPAPDGTPEPKPVDKSETTRTSWRELADFFVSFGLVTDDQGGERLQTRVHHSQADLSQQWEGLPTEALLQWMLSQANLEVPTGSQKEPPAESSFSPPGLEEVTALELVDVRVSEATALVPASHHSRPAPLRAASHLRIIGPAAEKLVDSQLPFNVELYLINTQTNFSELIASYSGRLTPGQMVYEIQQDFPTPTVGRYQLYVVARVLPPGNTTTHLQGPIIRVEP